MNGRFAALHPLLNFLFFAFVLLISMFYLNPIFLFLSFCGANLYLLRLHGIRGVLKQYCLLIPVMLVSIGVNIAFNHRGVTVLAYLPSGNPFTLESLQYALAAALMFGCVICWFRCCSAVLTSDKLLYLFGRLIPSLALLLSMTLRLLPRLSQKAKQIATAQRGLGHRPAGGTLWGRLKGGFRVLSILLTWALENAVDTADSMKARGFGLRKRTAFSLYTFHRDDLVCLVLLILLFAGTVLFFLFGSAGVSYFPKFRLPPVTPLGIASALCFALLCLFPAGLDLLEDVKWSYFRSKI